VLPNQSSFLLRFGVSDTAPADWSGSVETTGGRVASLAPWHFDKEDKLGEKPNAWSCSTRFAAVMDPKYWWLGALHIVPKNNTIPKAPLVPNGLFVAVDSAQKVRIKTAQGDFAFRPADARLGDALKFLNGRVEVERVPAAFNLTAGDGREDDYPTVAFDNVSNAWAAWIGYQGEKEKLLIARTDGAERQTIAEGEFFRPSLAASGDGKLYLAVSVHEGDTWKIAVATGQGSKWGKLETISSGGRMSRRALLSIRAAACGWSGKATGEDARAFSRACSTDRGKVKQPSARIHATPGNPPSLPIPRAAPISPGMPTTTEITTFTLASMMDKS
jgi:hypothetical protein